MKMKNKIILCSRPTQRVFNKKKNIKNDLCVHGLKDKRFKREKKRIKDQSVTNK